MNFYLGIVKVLKCSTPNSEAFFAYQLPVELVSLPISSQVCSWVALANLILQHRSKTKQQTSPKLIKPCEEVVEQTPASALGCIF